MFDPFPERLAQLYGAFDEQSRLSRDNVGRVEFFTTTTVLDRHLRRPARILDVAAGCGAYALHYANKGHAVWAQDIVQDHVAKMRRIAAERPFPDLDIAQGDAVDLGRFEEGFFDLVLCMGPLYHIAEEKDRLACIQENLRVLKRQGILVAAYLNTPVARAPRFKGELGGVRIDTCFFPSSPQETERLLRTFDLTIVDHLVSDGIARQMPEALNQLDDRGLSDWMQSHLETCRSPVALRYGWNGLVVCRKQSGDEIEGEGASTSTVTKAE